MIKNLLLLFGVLAFAPGCNSNAARAPAKGTILMPDGTPLTRSRVDFIPIDRSSEYTERYGGLPFSGLTEDGQFDMRIKSHVAGIPPGKYQVRVFSMHDDVNSTIPSRYKDLDASPWVVTITNGGATNIVLRMEN